MSTLEAAFGQLPGPIRSKLDSMIRRVRRLLFLRGLFATLAVALACLIAIMVVDATVTLFSTTARWALSLAGLAATSVAAWYYLVRPLSRKFTLAKMARILEIRHPELQERISTAVELLSSDDPDSIKGSEELIAAVVESAVDDVATVDPKTEFQPAKTRHYAKTAAIFAGIILVSLAIWPKQSWILLTRALAPFLDIGNAYADTLVVDPGDVRIAKGDSVSVTVSVRHKRLKRAEIRRRLGDGTESVERMTLIGEDEDGTKRFSVTFPAVDESFDYRIRAGAALSRHFEVETVEPPSIAGLTLRYDYPDYTGLATEETPSETGEIRAVAHTVVTATATLNKPVHSAKLFFGDSDRENGTPAVDGNDVSWEFPLLPGRSGSWRIELADAEGFDNAPASYPLEVLPDKAPTVQLTEPVLRELRLRPTESLRFLAAVTEDFGIKDSALLVAFEGGGAATGTTEIPQALPVATPIAGTYAASAELNLPSLGLTEDQRRLAVQLRVRDNRPGDYDGPGIGLSETVYITIDRNAKSLADQAIERQKQEVRENLEEAKRELERARDDMRRTEQEISRDEQLNSEAREKLREFSEHTENARDRLDDVAAVLEGGMFQEQADQARALADEKIAEARERADLVPVTDGKQEKIAEANQARQQVEEAIRDIDQLAREMREAEDEYRDISRLNEIADRQQQLAMQAEEMSREAEQRAAEAAAQDERAQEQARRHEQQQLDRFQDQQQQVQQQLGEMLKDNAAALDEILAEQQEQANSLAERSLELAQQQESLRELSEAATNSDPAKGEEALREQLLDQLRKRQQQLAEAAAEKAESLASANENDGSEPKGEEMAGEPATGEPAASNDAATPDTAGEPQTAGAEEQPGADAPQQAQTEPSSSDGSTDPAVPSMQEETQAAAREAAEQVASAAEQARAAAEALSSDDLSAAAEAAGEAGESLEQAAAAEPSAPESGQSAESGSPEMAESGTTQTAGESSQEKPAGEAGETGEESGSPAPTTRELAQQQQELAGQIAAVAAGDLQEALSQLESSLEADAAALQAEAQGLEEAMKNLSQRGAQSGADRAEQALQRGSQKAGDASRQLADAQQQQSRAAEQGRTEDGQLSDDARSTMQRSQNEQRQSQNFLEQAAQAMAQTSEAIGRTMEGLEPSEGDERLADSGEMAESFSDVTESAQSSDASQAAQRSQEAADSLRQLAQSAMSKLGNAAQQPPGQQPGQAMPPPEDLTGDPTSEQLNETGLKTADGDGSGVPPELQRLGISAEDWSRFKGALVGGNATAIETDLPPEYRELVGRYFQVIAKEAAKTEPSR